ncbi:MAG: crossover junction endodeoxyribonuclease RuvC [Kiritimatiellaeota bacterium]|nr:crossover junction endodeoxyribonuclease RuvC [Kiritimatiellota bacterium]
MTILMRIIGLDVSLRCTGLGVIERRAGRLAAVEYGLVRNKPGVPHTTCLLTLQRDLAAALERAKPDAAAIEGGFFFKNAKTAMILGEARGVVIATCAAAGVPVYEYAPRLVKQSLTGFGAAEKAQVAKMVVTILGLRETPAEDAADALALAICHAQHLTGIAELRPEPI